ncbi:hypothetical protein L7F22_043815 [Adiantum nelumboides]|nr:hypothetical protein [Adiantum nelumboides]
MNTSKVFDFVDLTLDSDDEDGNEEFETPISTPIVNQSNARSQGNVKVPANMQSLIASEEELASQTDRMAIMDINKHNKQGTEKAQFDLSSPEILTLSPFRRDVKRLPDLILMEQRLGQNKFTHRKIMEAEMNQHSLGSPDIVIENEVDKDWAPPFNFSYVNDYLLHPKLEPPSRRLDDHLTVGKGCSCEGDICNPKTCKCRKMHTKLAPEYYLTLPEDQFAYQSDGLLHQGVLHEEDTPIWECNDDCSCRGNCKNRVVSKGRKVGLILFKSAKKGWCVKLAEDVKAGQFIELYAGELITAAEANKRNLVYSRLNNTYVMDITPYHVKWHVHAAPYLRKKGLTIDQYVEKKVKEKRAYEELHGIESTAKTLEEKREERLKISDDLVEMLEKRCEDDPLLSIDGTLFGNITRYLAHSCEPNLIRHMVYTYERDIRRPLVAYFAKENLKAGQELTIHYEGISDHKVDGPHSHQMSQFYERLETMKCHCGAQTCSGFVFKGRDQPPKVRM